MKFEFLKQVKLSRFVAFDVETTGLRPANDSVIEFSAILFEDGSPKDTLTFLCNPGTKISEEIEILTGISNSMLKGKDKFEDHLEEVINFIGKHPLLAHNISFDMAFLKNALNRTAKFKKKRITNKLYDSLPLSRMFYFYLPNHKLGTISEYCGLSSEGSHRAEADTLNTGRIFVKLVEEAMKYNLDTLQIINFVMQGTNAPNKKLFQDIGKRLLLKTSKITAKTPKIDWKANTNIFGQRDETFSEDQSPTEICEKYFGAKGELASELKDFEPRPQQQQMAEIILKSLKTGTSAMIEAGTGVGKSLAYLVPAAIWLNIKNNSKNNEEQTRFVIATNTKTLQEQIFFKEIPFIFRKLKIPFKAVLLKGRSNYVCLTRWKSFIAELEHKTQPYDRVAILPIIIWLQHTKTGDISENNGFSLKQNWRLWKEICSEPGYCTTNACKKDNGCYLGKIRQQAVFADIVIVNHSLLFADAAAENIILPGYTDLIIDEAHNIEKNAYTFFASSINYYTFNYLLNDIISSGSTKTGLLTDIKQISNQAKVQHKIILDIENVTELIENLRLTLISFFKNIASTLAMRISENEKRFGVKKRYKNFDLEFPRQKEKTGQFINEITSLIENLFKLISKLDKLLPEFPLVFDQIIVNMKNTIGNLEQYKSNLTILTDSNDSDMVFWYEMDGKNSEKSIEISCTPLNISETLYENLFKNLHSAILTSATLQISNSFDYLKQRTGVSYLDNDLLNMYAVGSPYSYADQMKFITYHPGNGQFSNYNTTSSLLVKLSERTEKGILVLFTSYGALRSVYQKVFHHYKKMGIKLLAQGYGTSRTALLDQFREEKKSVLFGTDSFWEGVDVVGDALQILIIDKIPFAVPSEPIVEANREEIQNQGKNAFMDYYLPEAILKFRQGVGRLIRSSTDSGIIIFLDNRIDTKRYGNMLKNSLPVETETEIGEQNLINSVCKHFKC